MEKVNGYINSGVLFSCKKKNEIMAFAGKWVELEIQISKVLILHIFSHVDPGVRHM